MARLSSRPVRPLSRPAWWLARMTSPPVERRLDEQVAALLGPLVAGGFQAESGWRLVSWDAEQGICVTYRRGSSHLLIELEARDDGRDCYARTAWFNVCARLPFEEVDLTAEERAFVDVFIGVVRSREGDLPRFDRPTTGRRVSVRSVRVDRVLIPEGDGQYYINPYVGCMIGCPFCYVAERADFSRRLEGLPRMPWGRWVDAKVNAAEILREEVQRFPPGVVRMSPILTDPYQSVERTFRITRQCLQVLLEAGFAPAVLTRAARVQQDLDLLDRFERVLVGFTVPTDSDRIRQIFEPGADPIEDRMLALEAFHRAGIPTVALIQPILPMDVERLADRLAPLVRAVRIDRMFFLDQVRDLYERHDLLDFAGDAWFEQAAAELTEAFQARGVSIDSMDVLEPLVDRM